MSNGHSVPGFVVACISRAYEVANKKFTGHSQMDRDLYQQCFAEALALIVWQESYMAAEKREQAAFVDGLRHAMHTRPLFIPSEAIPDGRAWWQAGVEAKDDAINAAIRVETAHQWQPDSHAPAAWALISDLAGLGCLCPINIDEMIVPCNGKCLPKRAQMLLESASEVPDGPHDET